MEQQAQETKEYMDNQKVIGEWDNLGTQLVRRNDELSVLDEKINIQQSILNKGEIQYNQRVEDIRLLKLEIRNLRRENRVLNKTASNVEKLKHEVYYTQKELLKEQARCQSLQEELENPMNVHRWRRLEASDPDTFELIRKIKSLQRDLISKSKEVEQQDCLLQLLSAELNMYKSQVQEYKNEIEHLTGELQNVKEKYFMQKRKEQACR
ncbi:hypothetical protein KOW79_020697 [Hemibagrus wyckioides]|uniref:Cilia- and flagella-associated protein 58 central coiled coil domain-containing protein n=1 Tax=Hemibagrus wyckioides TaxID=337641 RepID=A0A9D3S921_9TELE|nr:hypothetical protein KOW79_020697 [Hemibagrus wyckioides]